MTSSKHKSRAVPAQIFHTPYVSTPGLPLRGHRLAGWFDLGSRSPAHCRSARIAWTTISWLTVLVRLRCALWRTGALSPCRVCWPIKRNRFMATAANWQGAGKEGLASKGLDGIKVTLALARQGQVAFLLRVDILHWLFAENFLT